MARRNTLPPPTDEELAAAEQTELRRRRERMDEIEKAQEEARLARAGDPDAKEALNATASVLASKPVGDGGNESADKAAPKATRPKASKRKETPSRERRAEPEAPKKEEPSRLEVNQEKAYKLMDAAYQKWAKTYAKDPRKANRELAIDLGRDTALYLRAGIIRLSDIQDTIQKLTVVKGGKDDDVDDQFEDDLESLRKELRGGK
jgi:hypothetical protein